MSKFTSLVRIGTNFPQSQSLVKDCFSFWRFTSKLFRFMLVLLDIPVYDEYIHHAQIKLCPNTQFLKRGYACAIAVPLLTTVFNETM